MRRRPPETLRRSAGVLFGLILLLISAISGAQDNRKLIRKIDPIYPPLACQNNIEGAVKVEITIAPDGSVKQVRSLGGNPVLSQAVENAVTQMALYQRASGHDADFDFAIQTLGNGNRASGK